MWSIKTLRTHKVSHVISISMNRKWSPGLHFPPPTATIPPLPFVVDATDTSVFAAAFTVDMNTEFRKAVVVVDDDLPFLLPYATRLSSDDDMALVP